MPCEMSHVHDIDRLARQDFRHRRAVGRAIVRHRINALADADPADILDPAADHPCQLQVIACRGENERLELSFKSAHQVEISLRRAAGSCSDHRKHARPRAARTSCDHSCHAPRRDAGQ